jgi:hypothetical protein
MTRATGRPPSAEAHAAARPSLAPGSKISGGLDRGFTSCVIKQPAQAAAAAVPALHAACHECRHRTSQQTADYARTGPNNMGLLTFPWVV